MSINESTDITCFIEGRPVPTIWVPDASGWIPNGPCIAYRDGRLRLEITYVHGVANGPYRDYWRNGGISLEGQFQNGLKHGEWRFYDRDTGQLREVLQFVHGKEKIDWDEFFQKEME